MTMTIEHAWAELQAVPSYVECQAAAFAAEPLTELLAAYEGDGSPSTMSARSLLDALWNAVCDHPTVAPDVLDALCRLEAALS